MPGRPYLLDNRGEDTRHADALSYLVDDLASSHGLSVATGYVNLGGLHYLATAVADGRRVRVLLGAAPAPGLGGQPPMPQFNLALEGLREEPRHGAVPAESCREAARPTRRLAAAPRGGGAPVHASVPPRQGVPVR